MSIQCEECGCSWSTTCDGPEGGGLWRVVYKTKRRSTSRLVIGTCEAVMGLVREHNRKKGIPVAANGEPDHSLDTGARFYGPYTKRRLEPGGCWHGRRVTKTE